MSLLSFSFQNLFLFDLIYQLVNSSIKLNLDKNIDYLGVDICKGENVDIVLEDPYKLPFENESVDAVISISTFEHTQFFWLSYLEILRVFEIKTI